MAGSYNHIVDGNGNLLDNEKFVDMLENLGDAYEAIEEMYGMIWWLAHMVPNAPPMSAEDLVEWARQQYREGLLMANANPNKGKTS